MRHFKFGPMFGEVFREDVRRHPIEVAAYASHDKQEHNSTITASRDNRRLQPGIRRPSAAQSWALGARLCWKISGFPQIPAKK